MTENTIVQNQMSENILYMLQDRNTYIQHTI